MLYVSKQFHDEKCHAPVGLHGRESRKYILEIHHISCDVPNAGVVEIAAPQKIAPAQICLSFLVLFLEDVE